MERGNEYERESGWREARGRQKLSERSRGGGGRESYREMFVGESTQGGAVKGFLEADTRLS